MAIYGVGAYYDVDVSATFLERGLIGVGWDHSEAPELQAYFKSLKPGDIVYLKAAFGGSAEIAVKGIGMIRDTAILDAEDTDGLVSIGRNVMWLNSERFAIARPAEKNNVRSNTIYEEFHPLIQAEVLSRIAARMDRIDSAGATNNRL